MNEAAKERTMATTFDSRSADNYEWTHGRKPRGFGLWMFEVDVDGEIELVDERGSYGEAKKKAMKRARFLAAGRPATVRVCT